MYSSSSSSRKLHVYAYTVHNQYSCRSLLRAGGRRERARAAPAGAARVQHQRAVERVRALLLRAAHARRVLRAHHAARAPHARARLQTRGMPLDGSCTCTRYSYITFVQYLRNSNTGNTHWQHSASEFLASRGIASQFTKHTSILLYLFTSTSTLAIRVLVLLYTSNLLASVLEAIFAFGMDPFS